MPIPINLDKGLILRRLQAYSRRHDLLAAAGHGERHNHRVIRQGLEIEAVAEQNSRSVGIRCARKKIMGAVIRRGRAGLQSLAVEAEVILNADGIACALVVFDRHPRGFAFSGKGEFHHNTGLLGLGG